MIIWSDNRKFPENIHTELIGRIEKEYPDKKKFYSSYFEGMPQHETYADLLLPYYGDVIVDIMRNLGM